MFSEENFEYECVYDDYLMPKLLKKVITYLNMGKWFKLFNRKI